MANGCSELLLVHGIDNRVFSGLLEVGLNVSLAHIVRYTLLDKGLVDLGRRDAMLGIVRHLLGSASVSFVNGLLHALCNLVGIENGSTIHIAGSSADSLGKRAMTTEEPFLVGIKDGDKRHFGQVESFTEEVNTDQHIDFASTQTVEDIDTLESLDFAMDIIGTHLVAQEILAELFRHTFGKSGDQYALISLNALLYLLHEVVNLVLSGAHLDDGVEQTCGTNHLLNDNAFRLLQLVFGGGSAHIDGLRSEFLELIEAEWTVVECGRQTVAVLHQRRLALAVTSIHGTNLRHTLVALVNDKEEVFGEEVEQAVWAFTRVASVEVARIVLDT